MTLETVMQPLPRQPLPDQGHSSAHGVALMGATNPGLYTPVGCVRPRLWLLAWHRSLPRRAAPRWRPLYRPLLRRPSRARRWRRRRQGMQLYRASDYWWSSTSPSAITKPPWSTYNFICNLDPPQAKPDPDTLRAIAFSHAQKLPLQQGRRPRRRERVRIFILHWQCEAKMGESSPGDTPKPRKVAGSCGSGKLALER